MTTPTPEAPKERLSAEERGAWWWLLVNDRTTLLARIARYTVCKVKHRWEYDMDWEPDAHAWNPGSANRLCRRCQTFEWCSAEQVDAAQERQERRSR